LLHRQREAEAAFDQAAAQYRSTVVTAFQNVADALRALEADANGVRLATAAANAASATLKITSQQLQLGQVAYLSVLNAEQTELQARINLALARAARLLDTAALFQALGGGWWNREDVQVKDINGDNLLGVLGLRSP
jgi:outer membrane protein TolC